MAVVLLLHPVPVAVPVGVRRPPGCELFCGSASSSRGDAGSGGAAWFRSGGGISSQSSSGARSDRFTMALLLLRGLWTAEKYHKSPLSYRFERTKHTAEAGS